MLCACSRDFRRTSSARRDRRRAEPRPVARAERAQPAARAIGHQRAAEGTTTALIIKEALDEKSLVTLLADRARPGNQVMTADFLGRPAPFPIAPWQLAAALKVPVVLCFGLYRGGNRYDLHFEPFADQLKLERARRDAELQQKVAAFRRPGWPTTRAARRTIGSTSMISGAPMLRRLLLTTTLLLLPATPAAALDADALIARLARPAPASVAFSEVRVSPLLHEPLVVSGELEFSGPTSLDRRVTQAVPRGHRDSRRIRACRARGRAIAQLRAESRAGIARTADGFSSLLTGDAPGSKRSFDVQAQGTEQSVDVSQLEPLDARARRRLQKSW